MTSPEPLAVRGMLPEQTFERLRDLIVKGRIPSGARVVEAEVALRFGVSRTPVREALARLLHERYLVPSSGEKRTQLVVAPFTSADVQELWGIVGALESYAVSLIISLSADQRTTIADELRYLNLKLNAAASARPRDPDKLLTLQTAFHVRFVNECTGPQFRAIYDAIRPKVQRYEWIYGTQQDAEYGPSTKEHRRIIAAIRTGDAITARVAVRTHWTKAADRTVRIIDALLAAPKKKQSASKSGRAARTQKVRR